MIESNDNTNIEPPTDEEYDAFLYPDGDLNNLRQGDILLEILPSNFNIYTE